RNTHRIPRRIALPMIASGFRIAGNLEKVVSHVEANSWPPRVRGFWGSAARGARLRLRWVGAAGRMGGPGAACARTAADRRRDGRQAVARPSSTGTVIRMTKPYIELSYFQVGLAALLILINGAISVLLRLELERRLLLAAVCTIVQLLLIGLVLEWVFRVD